MVTCYQLVSTIIIYISSIVKNLQIGTTYKKLILFSFKFVIKDMELKYLFIVDNFITFTFMKSKKVTICLIVLMLISIILITGSPFQITSDLVKSNGNLFIKNIGQVYGEEDEDGGDDGGGSDEESENGEESSEESENEYLSEENVDKSYNYEGEDESTETEEEKKFEEKEFVADLEDDLADADTPEEKERIQGLLDKAKEKFGLD